MWNLVLAHGFCNEQKSDALPDYYIEKLIARNDFILSKHPLKKKLLAHWEEHLPSGRRHILKVYEDARIVLRYTWQGIRGYNRPPTRSTSLC